MQHKKQIANLSWALVKENSLKLLILKGQRAFSSVCSGIRMYLILHFISFLYRLIPYNESVFTAILFIVPKGIMAIVLSGISNFSPIHVDDHRDEKNCILHLKKWLACQLSRLIIFFYIESFPAWVNFLLQLTRKLSYETQVQSLGREDPLKKGMATHSSILAWKIPQTEEPGGLQSMGS